MFYGTCLKWAAAPHGRSEAIQIVHFVESESAELICSSPCLVFHRKRKCNLNDIILRELLRYREFRSACHEATDRIPYVLLPVRGTGARFDLGEDKV
jgi:hypothetical protein